MKRLVLAVALFCVCLCGCNDYKELNHRYIISAIGVDSMGDKILLTLEVVPDGENRIYKAIGGNIDEAYSSMKKSFFKTPDFSHTACVIFGSGMSLEQTKDCAEEIGALDNNLLSAKLLLAQFANSYLNGEPADICIGYDTVKLLKENSRSDTSLHGFLKGEAKMSHVAIGENGIVLKEK